MSDPILVTGGAGFVGSHVIDALLAGGHEVRAVDLLAPPAHLAGEVEWLQGDIREPTIAKNAVSGASAVSHQAAMVGLGVGFSDVVDYVSHNDLGTAVLLSALQADGFAGRIVLAASMVVYGEGGYGCAEHGPVRPGPRELADLDAGRFEPPCPVCGNPLAPELVSEDARVDPRNVYAATKLQQEHLVSVFARESDAVSATALRYHNVYGPRMPRDTPYAGVASIFLSQLAADEAPRVFEDGRQRRDFVHVTDVARANVIALADSVAVSRTLNVASGKPRTVGEMASALSNAVLADPSRPVVTGEYRRGDVRHIVASPQRAAADLGFTAEVSFEDGMYELAQALPAIHGT